MRCTRRWSEIDSGWPALAGRRAASFPVGLWQMTHSWVVFRCPPWSDRESWHLLQFARATEVRRGVTDPVRATYLIGLTVDSWTAMSALPSARFSVAVRRMSTETTQVPLAPDGIAFVKV